MNNYSIYEWFKNKAKISPHTDAVIFEDIVLSYSELDKRVNNYSEYLIKLGIRDSDIVAIHIKRGINLPIIILAIMKIKAVYLPLEIESPYARTYKILLDSKPALLIIEYDFLSKFSSYLGKMERIENFARNSSANYDKKENKSKKENRLSYIIYTSGSTGVPKAVMGTEFGLANRLAWMMNHYKVSSKDRILHKTPISFDVSFWEILLPLISGATLVILPFEAHKDPLKIIAYINKYEISIIHFVPSMLDIFLDFVKKDSCKSLKNVFTSGEALPDYIAKKFFEIIGVRLNNLYGPTEAAIDVTFYECKIGAKVNIGKPIDNIKIYILNEELNQCKSGEVGEICIAGIGVAIGYLNKPNDTKDKFISNPYINKNNVRSAIYKTLYRTGDLGRFIENGNIEFLGRKDFQIKILGHRIELGEIENVVFQSGLVKRVRIVTQEKTNGQKVLVAAVILKDNIESHNILNKIKKYSQRNLPDYMVPEKFILLDDIPLTINGKIDNKKILEQAFVEVVEKQSNNYIEEHEICKIFSEVLGLKSVSAEDNFFDLGGNSILAMRILLRLKKIYGNNISIRKIIESNSIKELISYAAN